MIRAAGKHRSLPRGTGQETRFDLTAAFVRDGLASGLKGVWLSDAGPPQVTTELGRRGIGVEAAIASGQMTTADCDGCLRYGQAFSSGQVLAWLAGQREASRESGFPGLRG